MGDVNRTVRAKRNASTQKALTAKAERGEATGKERAVLRLGASNTKIITGQEDLSEWDDEELKRGQRRGKNGVFTGRPPKIVPKAIHDELVKRTLSRANKKLMEKTEAMVDVLLAIAEGADTEPKDALRAVNMVLERTMGKPADKVEFTGETPPWQLAIGTAIVSIKSSDVLGDDDDEEDE